MPTTFYWPTSQGNGCFHTTPPPTRCHPPCPPGPAIGAITIRYGRGCGLIQAIRAVERGRLGLCLLTETSRTETFPNNRRGYGMRSAAAWISRADGTQDGVGLGPRDHLNRRGREATRFHGTNVVSCESLQMVPYGYSVGGMATVSNKVLMVVLGMGLEANEWP